MTRAELLAEIEAARPVGYFDHVRPVLDHFVDLRVEIAELWHRLHRTRPGTERSSALTAEVCAKMQAAFDLAEVPHLGPGCRDCPPPRLQ
jgi:hypothetical protein